MHVQDGEHWQAGKDIDADGALRGGQQGNSKSSSILSQYCSLPALLAALLAVLLAASPQLLLLILSQRSLAAAGGCMSSMSGWAQWSLLQACTAELACTCVGAPQADIMGRHL